MSDSSKIINFLHKTSNVFAHNFNLFDIIYNHFAEISHVSFFPFNFLDFVCQNPEMLSNY